MRRRIALTVNESNTGGEGGAADVEGEDVVVLLINALTAPTVMPVLCATRS